MYNNSCPHLFLLRNMKEVFISYSTKDKEITEIVCSYLEQHHISCWVSYRDIVIGEPYAREIIRGIRETSIVVVLFSQHSNCSENVLNEIDQAVRLERTIIPFRIEKTEMSDEFKYYLSRRQWIDAHNNYKDELSNLLSCCKNALGKDELMNNDYMLRPQWAPYLSVKQKTMLQKLINDLTQIEGGYFSMGASQEQLKEAYEWEKPVHKVVLSDFYMTKHLVTQEIWAAIMPFNPSINNTVPNLPVENVTWYECLEFIKTINEMTGLSFSLPTEAQWEFAARGGCKNKGLKFSGDNSIDKVAWYDKNSGKETHPVGEKESNELGLYDMSGNVWEWCSDWYDAYDIQVVTDPVGAVSGTRKVLRGGSANAVLGCCRVSYRIGRNIKYKDGFLGFRLTL